MPPNEDQTTQDLTALLDARQPLPAGAVFIPIALIQELIFYFLFGGFSLIPLGFLLGPIQPGLMPFLLFVPLGLWLLFKGIQHLRMLLGKGSQRYGVIVTRELTIAQLNPGKVMVIPKQDLIEIDYRCRSTSSSTTTREHKLTLKWQAGDSEQTLALSSLKMVEAKGNQLVNTFRPWAQGKFKETK